MHVCQELAVKFRFLDVNLTIISVAITFCTAFKEKVESQDLISRLLQNAPTFPRKIQFQGFLRRALVQNTVFIDSGRK